MRNQDGFIVTKILQLTVLIIIALIGILISRHADEGEALYPFKVLGDSIEYYTATSPEVKIEIKLDRLEETNMVIRKAKIKNDAAKVADKTEEFEKKLNQIKEEVKKLKDKGTDTTDLELELEAVESSNVCAKG